MNVFKGYMVTKAYIVTVLILLMPFSALCKSEFRVVYQVDDQIISNYDIDQARKLRNLLSNSNLGRSDVEKIVINEKIKEIYANRLKIVASDVELKVQLDNFLKSNKINMREFKNVLSSKGIAIETFYNFVRMNIRWEKVLNSRFGYKINNLSIQDSIPLIPTPKRIEKEYEFSEIFISINRWGRQNANLIANRLEIELKAGAGFDKAVEKFSSAESKLNKGKVGPIKKSKLPKHVRDILDGLKKNQISKPFEINGGFIILKLNGTRSYKTAKTPELSVTFAISNTSSNKLNACSEDKEIRGPVLLSKVEKNIRGILKKLMPGESYKFSDKRGFEGFITLCESSMKERKNAGISYENIRKNEEALRLGNALMLELRRNTTIVKK